MVVHPPFCRVAAHRIRAKNTGRMRERPIVMSGMLHHVTKEEANSAAIDPTSNPNCISLYFVRDERGGTRRTKKIRWQSGDH